jgi:putative Flp pilus-assembly TadE/G-like protein
MKTNRWNWKPRSDRSGEAGQSVVFITLVLGIFLLGALCFAFDLSNMWFHRQSAQTAADAACAAGAMDILRDAEGAATGTQGFTLGTAYSCTTSSTDSICAYAAKNGYDTSSSAVSVSFPTTAATNAPPGVTIPPSAIAGANPFIRVDIVDHVSTFFAGLFNGKTTADVRAFSTCGVEQASAPIPLLVLDPTTTDTKKSTPTLSVQGTPSITIWGGPQQSIQVNSSESTAVHIGGSASIDLHLGGPNNTGSSLGTLGGPTPGTYTSPQFNPGSTGQWLFPSSPISDPFAQITAPDPTKMTKDPVPTGVLQGVDGCPDPGGCYEYSPGYYSAGICVGDSCPSKAHTTAIFQGGVYALNGFTAVDNSCLRPSTVDAQGIGGTMFYFTGGGAVNVSANSGHSDPKTGKSVCGNAFNTFSGTGMLTNGIKCTATSNVPTNLLSVTTLTGNVMLAPCTGPYGDPYLAEGLPDPASLGEQRGFLLFQDRSGTAMNQSWGGGGSFLLAGTMYFHSCNALGTGTNCGVPPTYYSDVFTLSGGSGSSTYMLGDIVADNVTLGGNSGITMDLNTTTAFSVLKASIFQ